MKQQLLLMLSFLILPFLMMGQVTNTTNDLVERYLRDSGKIQARSNTSSYKVTQDDYEDQTGIRRVQAIQKYNGIYVKDGILTLTKNMKDKIFSTDRFVDLSPNTSSPSLSAVNALNIAANFHAIAPTSMWSINEDKGGEDQYKVFQRNDLTASQPITRLIYVPNKDKSSLVLAWETQLHTADRQHYFITYVDAQSGEVISSEDKVLKCSLGPSLVYDASSVEQKWLDEQEQKRHMESARKWDETHGSQHKDCNHNHNVNLESMEMSAPSNSYLVLDLPAEAPNDDSANPEQTFVTTAGDPVASPFGWTSIDGLTQNTFTKGNNVYAFYDPSPGPLGGIPNPATAAQATSNNPLGGQQFHYTWDLSQEPEYMTTSTNNTFPNRNAAIVNLFYHNNLIHDIFYNFGFTEEGRNFQFENFGKGGLGNDEVLAQAQDGGGTNNANMLTLADGVNGQMQMYLWTASAIDELVKISSVSIPTEVSAGEEFLAIQGALYNSAQPIDIHENPVLDKPFVLINDGCGPSTGCGLGGGVGVAPCNDVTGAIVLIDRGDCSFVEKVDGAQKGGAAGVIVMNNNATQPDEVAAMGGTDPTMNTITIPAVMVSYNTGLKLKAALADGAEVIGSLQQDEPAGPKKDGDFDNGIIAHEYGHGISTRTSPQNLTGGSLSGDEQGGEGWSDYYALYLTTTVSDLSSGNAEHPNGVLPNRGIGTYVTHADYDGPGIRPRKYSIDLGINEYTFAGTTNGGFGVGNGEITVPHGVGFIWCTMLWDMTQNLVDEYGFNDDKTYNPPAGDIAALHANNAGNNLALKLIQEGIRMQPPSPKMTEMRDAILLADEILYDGAHSCLIWEAFAKRGLGVDAINPSNNIGDERDGYATPCNPNQSFHNVEISAPSAIENKSDISYTIRVTNTSDVISNDIIVTDVLPDHFLLDKINGADFLVDGDEVTFTVAEIPANSHVDLEVDGYVLADMVSEIQGDYGFESGSEGWSVVTGGPNEFMRKTDGDAHTGNAYYYTTNLGTNSGNTMLISPSLPSTDLTRQIRFWHKFSTDSGYDGGFLEYTVDGIEWFRLPLQENGYNGTLSDLWNPVNTGPAFTGTFSEYTESAGILPAGTTQVRFVFSEDVGQAGGDGWWIDDVKIVDNPVVISSYTTATDPIESGGRTYSDEIHTLIIPSTAPSFDLKPSMSVAPSIINEANTPVRIIVDVIEMSGNATSGPVKVRISKNDFYDFSFDSSLSEIGDISVDNQLWRYSENFLFWEFTTFETIPAGGSLRFGVIGNFNIDGQGEISITVKTSSISGLENNGTNDLDVETVNYSVQNGSN